MISLRSKITKAVLGELFLTPSKNFYVNELAQRLHLDSGNLTRKLAELEKEGLLQSQTRGRERYYSLSPTFPLLKEYQKIVLKTVGIEAQLRKLLLGVVGIRRAFIHGSYANDRMDASSDLDLIVIGDHRALDLQRKIAVLQKKVSREINLFSISPQEYEQKKSTEGFFNNLENGPQVSLI